MANYRVNNHVSMFIDPINDYKMHDDYIEYIDVLFHLYSHALTLTHPSLHIAHHVITIHLNSFHPNSYKYPDHLTFTS